MQLGISDVLGTNWALQVNPSSQQDTSFPFFSLDSPGSRWILFNRTSKLEAEIIKLHKSLQRGSQEFGGFSVFQQFTILGAVFAIHTGPTRKTNDEHWLQAIDGIKTCIENLAGTPNHETLHCKSPDLWDKKFCSLTTRNRQ